ncbi:MAG: hypothetical protein ABJO09_07440 [Hyphomicrobiales bacterium]
MPTKKHMPNEPIAIGLSRAVAIPFILVLLGLAGWLGVTILALPMQDESGVAYPVLSLVARYSLGFAMVLALASPAITAIRAFSTGRPFAYFDDKGVYGLNWPLMRKFIAWDDVDQLSGKGIWVVMIDKNKRQHKMIEGLMGAKGLWLPTIMGVGGAAPIAEAIRAFRPDLFSPEKLS